MMHKFVAVLAFLVMTVAGSQAQTAAVAKPDLSGTWKINLAKSDFGQAPAPTMETEVITQTGDNFKFDITRESDYGKREYSFSLKADGSDTPFPSNAFPADSPFKIISSSAVWQGASLAITQKTSFQDSPGTLKTTYALSPDGKSLTKATDISTPNGDFQTKEVFDKQ